MPVGEGEVLVEGGENRVLGFCFFHGKVCFRDCRPVLIGMKPVMTMFCFSLDMFICGLT